MSRLWVSWEGPVSRWGHLGAKAEELGRTLAAAHLVIRGPRSGGFSCRGEGVRACLGPGSPGSRAEAGGPIPTQIRGPGQEVRHSRERSAGAQESCQGSGAGWVPISENSVIGRTRATRGQRPRQPSVRELQVQVCEAHETLCLSPPRSHTSAAPTWVSCSFPPSGWGVGRQ